MKRIALSAVIVIGLVVSLPSPSLRAQEPTLDEVLARATTYAFDYMEALAGVVSEERYVQTWRRGSRDPQVRALRSDVLLTRPQGVARYLLFRDVFEVDGRSVRDRDARLLDLFLKPSASASSQIVRILGESARYNIGDITRTVNTPTLALVFLDPKYRERFSFTSTTDRVAETVRDVAGDDETGASRFAPADDLRVVAYQETSRDTLIGTGNGDGLPASGRYWIEPSTGRIVITEMQLRNPEVDALIDVRYDQEPEVGFMVPVAMRERYRDVRRKSVVEGSAQYSRVRRFQVSSSEAVADPKSPDAAPAPQP